MCHFDKACKKGLKFNYRHSDDIAHAKNPTANQQAEEHEGDVEDEDDNNEDASRTPPKSSKSNTGW